jgi:hypothetical protein
MRQVIAAVLVLLGCAACESAASVPPQQAPTAPITSPSTAPQPQLVMTWSPNLNWKHQHPVRTHGTAAQGRALLRDIRNAKRVPHNGAAYSCPVDFGVHVRFVLGAKRGGIDLGGCRFVQLGHRTYWSDAAIVRDLRARAPHRWLRYLK